MPPNPQPPVSVSVLFITETSATVTWIAPSDQPNNRILYFHLVLTDLKFGLDDVSITLSLTQLSFTFLGLEEFGSYSCSITTVSEYNISSSIFSTSFNTLASGMFTK